MGALFEASNAVEIVALVMTVGLEADVHDALWVLLSALAEGGVFHPFDVPEGD